MSPIVAELDDAGAWSTDRRPLIGLAITLIILRITWQSWGTVRGHHAHY